MVVALGALDANAEEELGGRFDRALRVSADPIVIGGRMRVGRAVGGQQLADELVHGHVALDGRANPAVEHDGSLGLDQPAVGAEDVGELEGPEVDELGAIQEAFDHLATAVGRLRGEKVPHLLGCGQDADRVEIDPANEFLVRADFGRADPHPVELGEDGPVNHVVLGNLGDLESGHVDQVSEPNGRHEVEIVGDDGGLAAVLEADVAARVNLGDIGARGIVIADRCHVTRRSIGQAKPHDKLLAGGRSVQDARLGQDLERQSRRRGGVVLGAFLDPVMDKLVALAVSRQPQSPLVGNFAEWLAEQEAGVGGQEVDSPAASFPAQGQEILVGKVPAEAEAKTPFARGRAVASACVASRLAERRNHVAAKTDGCRIVHALDLQLRHGLDRTMTSHDRGGSVAFGNHLPPVGNHGDLGIEAGPGKEPGQISKGTVGVLARDDELTRGSLARERRVLRPDGHLDWSPDLVPSLVVTGCGFRRRKEARQSKQEQTRDQTTSLASMHQSLLSEVSQSGPVESGCNC